MHQEYQYHSMSRERLGSRAIAEDAIKMMQRGQRGPFIMAKGYHYTVHWVGRTVIPQTDFRGGIGSSRGEFSEQQHPPRHERSTERHQQEITDRPDGGIQLFDRRDMILWCNLLLTQLGSDRYSVSFLIIL